MYLPHVSVCKTNLRGLKRKVNTTTRRPLHFEQMYLRRKQTNKVYKQTKEVLLMGTLISRLMSQVSYYYTPMPLCFRGIVHGPSGKTG